ncbi:MAG: pyridoxamine 5'-phosphate oxidase family protein [Acidimicrobiales bacterium]
MGVLDELNDDVAQELLTSRELARLAYTWSDGTPRVVPICFHWTGTQVVVASPAKAPKVKQIEARPDVAVTIDGSSWPFHALIIRGTAKVDRSPEVVPEYVLAVERYFGPEQGRAWVAQLEPRRLEWAKIAITPTKATVLDFETRFPSAITA